MKESYRIIQLHDVYETQTYNRDVLKWETLFINDHLNFAKKELDRHILFLYNRSKREQARTDTPLTVYQRDTDET